MRNYRKSVIHQKYYIVHSGDVGRVVTIIIIIITPTLPFLDPFASSSAPPPTPAGLRVIFYKCAYLLDKSLPITIYQTLKPKLPKRIVVVHMQSFIYIYMFPSICK